MLTIFNMDSKGVVPVEIPKELYERLKAKVDAKQFSTVESYIIFALNQILAERRAEKEPFSKNEENEIKERLRSLGYM